MADNSRHRAQLLATCDRVVDGELAHPETTSSLFTVAERRRENRRQLRRVSFSRLGGEPADSAEAENRFVWQPLRPWRPAKLRAWQGGKHVLQGRHTLGAGKDQKMLASSDTRHLPIELRVAARPGNPVGSGGNGVGNRLPGLWKQEKRFSPVVFIHDVDVRRRGDAELHEESVVKREAFARAQLAFDLV